ncbi:hypothetical protein ACFSBZ_16965 [Amnibacterium flavum]|uniref:Uncharacterized protein n=1 Tax=Amnibacterium flavum TaxID=2173173 RepID=A0A2V1HS98_9MICO|nr:hypothetical protein [Amnibacterium flavum]PVZ93187.1 hypothetical protein DDQ50_16825 [Amnibacterium flavum]
MSAELKPPRGRGGWIILAVILAVAAIVAAAVVYGSNSSTDATVPTQSQSTSATPGEVGNAGADVQPTGCLGGEARDADMLLSAQRAAPHTTNGATELAASFVRWMQRSPLPPADGINTVQSSLITSRIDVASYLAHGPDFASGLVEDGQDFYMSTIGGVWLLDSANPDAVTVSIGTAYVIDGALSPRYVSSVTVALAWDNGQWRIDGFKGTRTTETLFAAGTKFTEGC